MRITGGIPIGGNLSGQNLVGGNPFGPSFVIPRERTNPPGAGPQTFPLNQTPAMPFPQDQPGREGAINVQFRQAQLIPGMIPMGNAGFFYGPQLGQMPPAGFQNKFVS